MKIEKIKIPQAIRRSWKSVLMHGEIEIIAEKTGISRNTISNAINNGNCEQETFEAIKIYFFDKAQSEKKLIKETLK